MAGHTLSVTCQLPDVLPATMKHMGVFRRFQRSINSGQMGCSMHFWWPFRYRRVSDYFLNRSPDTHPFFQGADKPR